MKCHKSMWQILHWGWSNAQHQSKLGEGRLGSSPAEQNLGAGRLQAQEEPAATLAPRGQTTSWGRQTRLVWPEGAVPRCSALAQPRLQPCVQCGPHRCRGMGRSLDAARGGNRAGEGLEGRSCEELPRALGLSSLERRRLRSHFLALQLPEGTWDLLLGSRDRMPANGQNCAMGALDVT